MATESPTLVLLALVANAIIAVIKFIAAAMPGTDDVERVIDRIEATIRESVPDASKIFAEPEVSV